jgi:hypothetical protein
MQNHGIDHDLKTCFFPIGEGNESSQVDSLS